MASLEPKECKNADQAHLRMPLRSNKRKTGMGIYLDWCIPDFQEREFVL
jgi:hypothetical protein